MLRISRAGVCIALQAMAFFGGDLWAQNRGFRMQGGGSSSHQQHPGHGQNGNMGGGSGGWNNNGNGMRPPFPPGGHRPSTEEILIRGGLGILEQAIKSGNQNDHHHHHPQNNNWPQNRVPQTQFYPQQPQFITQQPQYVPQPQPQYVPQPTPVVTNVAPTPPTLIKNAIPKPKPVALVANPPAFSLTGLDTLSGSDYASIRDAVDQSMAADVEELTEVADDLKVANDPDVQQTLENIQKEIDQGGPVSDEAVAAYEKAVEKAVTASGSTLTPDDIKRIAKTTGSLQTKSQIAGMFDPAYPPGGFDPNLSWDNTNLAVIPGLPPGQVLCLPGGGMITGAQAGGEMAFLQTTAADLLELPVGAGDPASANLSTIQQGVLIVNPAETGSTVNFQFDGANTSLAAGESKLFTPQSGRQIQFDPGNGGATIRYSLEDGTYVFSADGAQWALANRQFTLVVENQSDDVTFHYQASGSPSQLAPGSALEHQSRYPIVIRFNRGRDGAEAERSFLEADVRATLALNPEDQLWDLFRSDSVKAPASGPAAVFDPSAFETRKGKEGAVAGSGKGVAAKPVSWKLAKRKPAFDLSAFRKALKPE